MLRIVSMCYIIGCACVCSCGCERLNMVVHPMVENQNMPIRQENILENGTIRVDVVGAVGNCH